MPCEPRSDRSLRARPDGIQSASVTELTPHDDRIVTNVECGSGLPVPSLGTMRRILSGTTVLLAATLALTGCSAAGGASDEAGAPIPAEGAQDPGFVADGDAAGGGDSAGDGSTSSVDRQVII